MKRRSFALVIIAFVVVGYGGFFITSPFLITNVSAQEEPVQNNSQFEAFFPAPLNYRVFDFYNYAAGQIGAVTGEPGTPYFFKPTNPSTTVSTYPGIEAIQSDVFLCDSSGNFIEDPASAMSDPNEEIQFQTEGDTIYYLRRYWLGMDIGVKTRTNFPETITYYEAYVSPLDDMKISHAGRTDWDAFDMGGSCTRPQEPYDPTPTYCSLNAGEFDINTRDGWSSTNPQSTHYESDTEPYGVIAARVDCGTASKWTVTYLNNNKAKIYNSLVDMNPYLSPNKGTAPTNGGGNGYSSSTSFLTDVANKLRNNFGNRPVIVYVEPVINIGGQITYDYSTTQEDGTQFRIYSTSGDMGFYQVKTTVSHTRFGNVTNYAQDIADREDLKTLQIQISDADALKDTITEARADETTLSSSNLNSQYLDWWMLYKTPRSEFLESQSLPTAAIRHNLGTPRKPTINIDTSTGEATLPLPKQLQMSVEFTIEPFTKVTWANYECKYSWSAWDGAFPDYKNEQGGNLMYITYPCKIYNTNVYCITRVVFSVLSLSTIKGEIIKTSGEPVNVDDWGEYSINSFGSLVDLSSFAGTYTSKQPCDFWDIACQLSGLTSIFTTIITFVVIIAVVIVAIWIIPKLIPKRR